MCGIFFGEFQCLPVDDYSAVSCDSSALTRGSETVKALQSWTTFPEDSTAVTERWGGGTILLITSIWVKCKLLYTCVGLASKLPHEEDLTGATTRSDLSCSPFPPPPWQALISFSRQAWVLSGSFWSFDVHVPAYSWSLVEGRWFRIENTIYVLDSSYVLSA